MKTLQELIQERAGKLARLDSLIDSMTGSATIAARSLTADEQAEITTIRTALDALDVEISNAETLEARKAERAAQNKPAAPAKTEEQKVAARFSIMRAAQLAAGNTSNRVDYGLEREMDTEARAQANAINLPTQGKGVMIPGFVERSTAASATDAGNLIPTNQLPVVDGYKPVLIMDQLGCTMHTNLTGINDIPVSDLTGTASFVDEGGSFPTIAANVTKPRLTAKALMAKTINSWYLKAQANADSDTQLRRVLDRAEANALNKGFIKRQSGFGPLGLLDMSGVIDKSTANGSALTRDILTALINSPDAEDAMFNSEAFLVSPAIREALMNLKADQGSGQFVWPIDSRNTLLGYPAPTSTVVPKDLTKGTGTNLKGIIFGHFSELHVANWAVRELIVDPASNDAGVVIKSISFWDWVATNPKAFAKAYIV